jgi:3-hydroxybutyryl-CoA dehydratase
VNGGRAPSSGAALAVGTRLPPYSIAAVDPESMKLWAAFLHDPNPIHLDPRAVQAKGLGDKVINQGPANLAYVITMLQRAFPGSTLVSLAARYAGSVFAEDTVQAGGTIVEVAGEASGVRIRCDVWLRANERDPAITGQAVLVLPKE